MLLVHNEIHYVPIGKKYWYVMYNITYQYFIDVAPLKTIMYRAIKTTGTLKGQCHEIFDFWFFSLTSFPQAPECTVRTVSRRYSQLNDTGGKCKKSSIKKVLII
jgi:hypothetical protein